MLVNQLLNLLLALFRRKTATRFLALDLLTLEVGDQFSKPSS
jgi:hypothetical protein